jgi:hypothetical protein
MKSAPVRVDSRYDTAVRVLLVSANTERANMPAMPLGAVLVAEATRAAGHEVVFLDLFGTTEPAETLRRTVSRVEPAVMGISVRNIDDQVQESPRFLLEQIRPLIAACRCSSDAPIVLGGAGYSIVPDAALDYLDADFGIAGDGEAAFPALLRFLERGVDPSGLAGVHVRGRHAAVTADFSVDLGDVPCVGDGLWSGHDPVAPETWVPVQGRRGCANDCSYCSTRHIQGRALRCRPPELVAESVRTAA